jgi:hypothetical protein
MPSLSRNILAALACIGLAATVVGGASAAQAAGTVTLPPANAQFDYQIGAPYTPAASVGVVSRDHSVSPAAGKYNICYVNAYQTQPDDTTTWAGANSDLILHNAKGEKVGDPEWNEYLLDTSTPAKRTRIAAIVNGWVTECAAKGFNAVEPDNLDSWTRSTSGGKQLLSKQNNVDLAKLLTTFAHQKGLAIAQKNTTDLGSSGKNTIGFDFAIAEECQANAECGDYTSVYGNNVIEIEYNDNDPKYYSQACAAQGKQISVIYRDRDVVAKGQSGYTYKYC